MSGPVDAHDERPLPPDAEPDELVGPVGVVVEDIDIPFWSLTGFMVKWAIASIPAMIILLVTAILVGGLLVGFLREFR